MLTLIPILLFVEGIICKIAILSYMDPEKSTSLYCSCCVIIDYAILWCGTITYFKQENTRLVKYINFALAIKLLILIWDVNFMHIFALPNSEGDAVGYNAVASSYAFGNRSSLYEWDYFPFYVGQIYKLFGIQRCIFEFINVYCSIISIILVYSITKYIHLDKQCQFTSVALLCILPNYHCVTTILLQESIVSFGLILSLFFYVKWWRHNHYAYFFLACITSLLVAYLHIGGSVTAFVFIATLPFVKNKYRSIIINTANIVMFIVVAFSVLYILNTKGSTLLKKTGGEISVESISEHSKVKLLETTSASYDVGMETSGSIASMLIYSPFRMIMFLASPLPWKWRGLADMMSFCGSSIFYLYIMLCVKQAILVSTKTPLKSLFYVLLGCFLLSAFMFGWGVSNAGTALRHREKFTALYTVFLAVSLHIVKSANNNLTNQ